MNNAYERSLEAFTSLKSYAEAAKVNIGLENVWNKFLTSPLEMRDFIDKIDSEYVGSYFDVGNVLYNGYPEHWIKALGKRIKKVHFKDYRKDPGGINCFVPILSGDVDYAGVSEVAGYITPVPGGVGPMTITMLLKNTLTAAREQNA